MRKLSMAAVGLFMLGWAQLAPAQRINGAGATFPAPIYQKWFDEYHKLHPSIEINYQSIGSGGGKAQLTAGTVDFGASDYTMTDEEMAKLKIPVLHFPTVMGGVVPAYNIPGISQELKFEPEVLADIFLGKITKWNDKRLAAANPGVKLPNAEIIVVHRSDGSGTTFCFTDFLAKVSPEWKSKVGPPNGSVNWPVGLGGKGNEGVAGFIKQNPGSLGYVELFYAVQEKMLYGSVKNSSGVFLRASLESVTAAAAATAKNMPADFRVSITNAPDKGAYPISTFTWLLVPTKIPDAAKEKAITGFLQWMLTDGQKYPASLSYAPLPKEVVAKELKQIALIK